MPSIRLGLCGFTISQREYYETWSLLEVQQTFYDPPQPSVLHRWKLAAPDGFEFTMKAWQVITHMGTSSTYRRVRRAMSASERAECGGFRLTPTVLRGWEETLRCARALHASCILFQCPASFRPSEENVNNMTAFFNSVDRPDGVQLLWEPRGAWDLKTVETLCRELDLVHALDPFVMKSATPEFLYYRLHGTTGSRHVYTDKELHALLDMLPAEANQRYVLFNNIPRTMDAPRFERLVKGSSQKR